MGSLRREFAIETTSVLREVKPGTALCVKNLQGNLKTYLQDDEMPFCPRSTFGHVILSCG